MSSKAMSLKGNIKNYAKSNNIAAQAVFFRGCCGVQAVASQALPWFSGST